VRLSVRALACGLASAVVTWVMLTGAERNVGDALVNGAGKGQAEWPDRSAQQGASCGARGTQGHAQL
jgi:hypothetical protein